MGSLYSGTSVSGYNSNPPPDDGSTGSNNQITWNSTIKAKLTDPLNTAIASASTALVSGLGKTISGGTVVKTGISYAMGPADQGRCIVATASGITITTPDATSVLNPFAFFFSNQSTGTITLAGNSNGSQTVDGNTSTTIYPGCGGILQTDGSNWFSNGLVQGNIRTVNPTAAFTAPINLQLNASVGSNLLTVAVKANNGSDPSTSNPVLIPFRDATIANGDPVWVAVTSALSINTNATGATLGVPAANTPFRYWVMAFNNSGTVVLALINASTWTSTTAQIFPLNESGVASTTAISAAATSAGVFYTPNGTTLSNCAFRIIGYVEYNAGLSTNGTFASAPTSIQLFGPGVRKPGDPVQSKRVQATSAATTTSAGFTGTNLSTGFALTSSINLVRIKTAGGVGIGGATAGALIVANTTDSVNLGLSLGITGASGTTIPVTTFDFYQPKSTASKTYNVQIASDGTHTVTYPQGTASSGSYMELDEVMG